MSARRRSFNGVASVVLCLTFAAACAQSSSEPAPDEALRAGRTAESLRAADEDYFGAMDGGVSRKGQVPAAIHDSFVKGRNNWIAWTAGNDRLWDYLANHSFGALDFLKTLSSHPSLGYGRDHPTDGRWKYLGLVNEPCFEKAQTGDPDRYGLWLDKRIVREPDCPADPFANAQKYPGVAIGARGKNIPVGSHYGEPSGIVGLRLFPNPDFDEAAAKRWDVEKYYTDKFYYEDAKLVRPYRVGMSCGFCHVGPSPTNPPVDFENPRWENLNSNPGAQYFWIDRIFFWNKEAQRGNFVWELFHTQLPGTLDTSLVSSDNINNPRTMNAIYALGARLNLGKIWGRETLAGGGLLNKQFNAFERTKQLAGLFQAPDTVLTPRVLKDGADSVGALGALNRVYLNIGLASEEWLRHFTPLIGPTPLMGPITPIRIEDLEKVSSYWQANVQQTPDVALFFYASAQPDYLKNAPGGTAYLTSSPAQLARGKVVFANTCARCHSSKLPDRPPAVEPPECVGGGNGRNYLSCWDKYWQWTKTDDFKQSMQKIVSAPDFLDDNFLSTERRVPVTLLETNACSPLATNAIADNIWDNFSSQSYKELPSVGNITVYHPMTGAPRSYHMPDGGRGYTRPASLISLWSSAPFLLNNSVGRFSGDASVHGRMTAFDDAIKQMLWPERRQMDSLLGSRVRGYMQRTTSQSYLRIAPGYLPEPLRPLLGWRRFLSGRDPDLEIGPIPKGTPVGLLANLALLSESRALADRATHLKQLKDLFFALIGDLKTLPRDPTDEQARAAFGNVVDKLWDLSKCPDYVVNRGHYFGTDQLPPSENERGLSDADKGALIEFLKTF